MDNEFCLMKLERLPFSFYMTSFLWHIYRQIEAKGRVAAIIKSKIK
jgi:hypothetical protein